MRLEIKNHKLQLFDKKKKKKSKSRKVERSKLADSRSKNEILWSIVMSKTSMAETAFRNLVSSRSISEVSMDFILTHYHTMPHFDALKIYIAVENIVRKKSKSRKVERSKLADSRSKNEILWSIVMSKTSMAETAFRNLVSSRSISEVSMDFILTHYHTMPHFDALKIYIAVENIVRKKSKSQNVERSKLADSRSKNEILWSIAMSKTSMAETAFRNLVSSRSISEVSMDFILTHYHTMPHFDALKIYIAVENIVRKGEIACNKQFLLFLQGFLPYIALIFHRKCTFRCRLQFVSICRPKFCRMVMG